MKFHEMEGCNWTMRRVSVILVLALVAALISGCRFAVVESDSVRIGSLNSARAESGVLSLGSRDEAGSTAVYEMQLRLIGLGYLTGEPDGVFGSASKKALRAFQKDRGLKQTGKLDIDTEIALYSQNSDPVPDEDADTPMDAETVLESGSFGSEVETVQRLLRTYGFSVGEVSGTYDSATMEAVTAIQEYAVERYGTEFDEPDLQEEAELLPVTTPVPQEILAAGDIVMDEPIEAAMPVLTPEPTLRPDYLDYGTVSANFYNYLVSGRFPAYHQTVQSGDSGIEVQRLQNRLSTLEYFYGDVDGDFGRATESALKMFQKRNSLQQTGIADAETQALLYSDAALSIDGGVPVDMPFYIKVSIDDQRVYVYRLVDGEYDYLVRTMVCSTGMSGTDTPKGIFTSTGRRGGQWHYFVDFDCWAQYAFVIKGNILFHSILYSKNTESSIRKTSVSNLGRRASHGCVRLSVADAKWIWTNCTKGQKIEIY